MTAGGHGKWSQIVRLNTLATRPSPPSSLEAVGKVSQTSITLQWGKHDIGSWYLIVALLPDSALRIIGSEKRDHFAQNAKF